MAHAEAGPLSDSHPNIDLRIGTTARLIDFRTEGVALAVRMDLGFTQALLLKSWWMMPWWLLPVRTGQRCLGPPLCRSLAGQTLIHDGPQ